MSARNFVVLAAGVVVGNIATAALLQALEAALGALLGLL